MCLAQGPQRSDAGEARTRGPSVSSQALYHWATALSYTNCGGSWTATDRGVTSSTLKVKSMFDNIDPENNNRNNRNGLYLSLNKCWPKVVLTHLSRMYFPILINWTSPLPSLGLLVCYFFIFIQILKAASASKQWRAWSDAAFCGVWSVFFHCLQGR